MQKTAVNQTNSRKKEFRAVPFRALTVRRTPLQVAISAWAWYTYLRRNTRRYILHNLLSHRATRKQVVQRTPYNRVTMMLYLLAILVARSSPACHHPDHTDRILLRPNTPKLQNLPKSSRRRSEAFGKATSGVRAEQHPLQARPICMGQYLVVTKA
jgi:hypothetical protein